MNWKVVWSLMVLVVVFPSTLLAFEVGNFHINGFVSQGYLDSSENNFLTEDSKEGSTQFREIGMTAQGQLTDKLRVGVQLLSRDLGDVGNDQIRLDWAYADYRFNDQVGIRLGKVKLPLGLYNEGRDTDMLRPMVFLPQSIYDETKRDLLVAYMGSGLYGNLTLGALGDLDYHAFYGTIDFPDDALLNDALTNNATFTLRTEVGPDLVPVAPGSTPQQKQGFVMNNLYAKNLEIDNDYIAGGAVVLNTAVEGLRFGLSYLRVKNDLDFNSVISIDPLDYGDPALYLAGSGLSGTLTNESTWVGSVEYVLGNLALAAEYAETDREQTFAGYTGQDATSQSYYLMASYTFLEKFTLSLLYDVFYSDKDDKDGKDFAATSPARRDFFSWRKDFGIGLRYDVNANWTLKAEYHDVNGTALFMTVLNDPADLEEDWEYAAFKVSYNF